MSSITSVFLVMSSLGEVLGHPLICSSGLTLLNLLDLSVHFMLFGIAVTMVCVHLLVNFFQFYTFCSYKSCGNWHVLVLATGYTEWHVTTVRSSSIHSLVYYVCSNILQLPLCTVVPV
jgi:hypothetical protein